MIKPGLQKILSLSLALVVMFSTLSFKVEKYYCKGELVDIAIVSTVRKCCPGEIENSEFAAQESCCSNEIQWVYGQDELDQKRNESIEIPQKKAFVALSVLLGSWQPVITRKHLPESLYPPPNLYDDIQLLHQVYLI